MLSVTNNLLGLKELLSLLILIAFNTTVVYPENFFSDAVCPDIILSSCSLPTSEYIQGTVRPLQIYVKRELDPSESDDQLVYTISQVIFSDFMILIFFSES